MTELRSQTEISSAIEQAEIDLKMATKMLCHAQRAYVEAEKLKSRAATRLRRLKQRAIWCEVHASAERNKTGVNL